MAWLAARRAEQRRTAKPALAKTCASEWRSVLGKSGQSLDSRTAAKNLSWSRAPHTCPLQRDRRPFWLVRHLAALRGNESVRERDVSSVGMRRTVVHYDLDPRRFACRVNRDRRSGDGVPYCVLEYQSKGVLQSPAVADHPRQCRLQLG